MNDALSSNFLMECQKFWSYTLGNTAWSWLMTSNPNGGQTRKLWAFFGFFATVILNWLRPINSKHHSMLSPASHLHPPPLTWAPPTDFWLVSLLLTSSGSNQPPYPSLGYSKAQNWLYHFLLKNLQQHPFTWTKLHLRACFSWHGT